ncbi:putative DNA modification methylase [Mycobacteroides abscessus]|uniref:site-specific DNA-methyltransferase (cytosine-N(4)-specific) n=1 Tax=Mycobacteroides abscessus subsp. bolletii 50594 TaxID=1303024 RepID=A0AB33A763_9MYCO|nr:putative DNA modification methylase [Mycobacteroides abscessus]AGM27613.1 putative DNA modification methylase [Mycobacteroides abscessus subsp. bolletii 50594]BBZ82384.1 hypothetical protein MABM_23000 [Mycobacteroides abscessus]
MVSADGVADRVVGPQERLNTACPYFTMFPLSFPIQLLARASAGQWVLDPFCGRGTTLFAARMLGLPAVGIDANPVAAAVAAAKVSPVDLVDVEAMAVRILTESLPAAEVPEGEFWELCYHRRTLADICVLRESLAGMPADNASANLLRAIVLGILHGPLRKREPTYLSNQMPRTYATKPNAAVKFWKNREMTAPYVNVRSAVLRRLQYTLAETPAAQPGAVHLGEASQVLARLRRRFDWVITSPPYYRMYTYLPDQWLRNWFVGGPAAVDYSVAGQISHSSETDFAADLGRVWSKTAARCNPGATLAIRFGALPSVKSSSPEELLRESLRQADAGWKVTRVSPAGQPTAKARQAVQMGNQAGDYAPEIDLLATWCP